MKTIHRIVKFSIWSFIIFTGVLAASGLMMMDHSFRKLFRDDSEDISPELLQHYAIIKENIILKKGSLDIYYTHVPDARYAVFLAHDGWNTISSILEMFNVCNEMKISLFTYDYRLNDETGKDLPSESSLLKDTRSAFSFTRKKFFPKNRIILYGQGIGAAPISYIAERNQCAALMFENPVPSLKSMLSGTIERRLAGNRLFWKSRLLNVRSLVFFIFSDTYPMLQKDDAMAFRRDVCRSYRCFYFNGDGTKLLSISNPDEWMALISQLIDEIEREKGNQKRNMRGVR